ncbi:hypothetical protein W02_05340 [Nitrospira sp. KM1]|uniref:PilZ domain-containing protein n=1 Tax=Nitrospira sp. KM1 TaxID=1936990 RepID=UPI0013A72D35|nr:PilZ domain-containing protein [Nitrospira sp. KM1]BCA53394.1 hypothetical protein W02_05340 [Nitrospira sp. KM1]
MVTRKFKRFAVAMSSTVIHKDQFKHQGSVRDLSAKGCRIESLIKPFTGMQMSLLLHVSGASQPIRIDNAAIRWCGAHGMGMEFLSIAPADSARLGLLLKELEARPIPT